MNKREFLNTLVAVVIACVVIGALFGVGVVLITIRNNGIDQQIEECLARGGKPYTSGSGGHVTCVEHE